MTDSRALLVCNMSSVHTTCEGKTNILRFCYICIKHVTCVPKILSACDIRG